MNRLTITNRALPDYHQSSASKSSEIVGAAFGRDFDMESRLKTLPQGRLNTLRKIGMAMPNM